MLGLTLTFLMIPNQNFATTNIFFNVDGMYVAVSSYNSIQIKLVSILVKAFNLEKGHFMTNFYMINNVQLKFYQDSFFENVDAPFPTI
jgi:hypothetical protein